MQILYVDLLQTVHALARKTCYHENAYVCYFPLPEKLKLKRAIVNVQNKDEQCFKWAVLSAVFPVEKKTERLSNYTSHEQALDWTGLTFPGYMAADSENGQNFANHRIFTKIGLMVRRNYYALALSGCL